MTDRDELAAIALDICSAWDMDPIDRANAITDQILARWRLVPVEKPLASGGHIFTMRHADGCTCGYDRNATQHRAAGELTRHDQTAGIYDSKPSRDCQDEDCIKPRTHNGPCAGIGGINL